VRAAERILLDDPTQNKEYLPIDGDKEFVDAALRFAYGEETPQEHLAGVQTLSGTGACRIGGAFLNQFWPRHPIYIPDPTWGNHIAIFKEAGLKVKRYRYYNKADNCLDLEGFLEDLQKAPNASIVLLHACAHNPTGCDPTIDEWKQIISLISEKEHIAFFDSAYQGFASGDAEEDAQPFRYGELLYSSTTVLFVRIYFLVTHTSTRLSLNSFSGATTCSNFVGAIVCQELWFVRRTSGNAFRYVSVRALFQCYNDVMYFVSHLSGCFRLVAT